MASVGDIKATITADATDFPHFADAYDVADWCEVCQDFFCDEDDAHA